MPQFSNRLTISQYYSFWRTGRREWEFQIVFEDVRVICYSICHLIDRQGWFGWSGWSGGCPPFLPLCSMCISPQAVCLVKEDGLPWRKGLFFSWGYSCTPLLEPSNKFSNCLWVWFEIPNQENDLFKIFLKLQTAFFWSFILVKKFINGFGLFQINADLLYWQLYLSFSRNLTTI